MSEKLKDAYFLILDINTLYVQYIYNKKLESICELIEYTFSIIKKRIF